MSKNFFGAVLDVHCQSFAWQKMLNLKPHVQFHSILSKPLISNCHMSVPECRQQASTLHAYRMGVQAIIRRIVILFAKILECGQMLVEMNANEERRGHRFERCANSYTAILVSSHAKRKLTLALDWDRFAT